MNPKFYDVRSLKDQVKIADLLSRLGYEPANKKGSELLYTDVLAKTLKPSFCVNNDLGSWYDHSLGKGGDLIDFGQAYWKLPFKDALEKIILLCNLDGASLELKDIPERTENRPRLRKATKLPHYVIENILPLGNHPAITDYLNTIGIPGVPDERLREVYYYKEDEKGKRTSFFSAGWQTENGSWWVKNKYFDGPIGKAATSYYPAPDAEMLKMEVYLDYFDFVLKNRNSPHSILLLNSYDLLAKSLTRMKKYLEVKLNFEDNQQGRKAAETIMNAVPSAKTDLKLRPADYQFRQPDPEAGLRYSGPKR
ncbi:hypothetical protein HDC92_004332 [Pedobacter sp. AK017]|uniref:hypothetical protein n=1 Tax=Pedobacter sp. AK017 TaxID=2723073 RepID=UPI00160C1D2F|nr:hypothetical protein [Pedobacter sp. AK017]MBB5440629.1 hypothetical protein [Pedobacter sp. AK017]